MPSLKLKSEQRHVGAMIRKLREDKGVKQNWLAEQLNIKQVTLSNYERGINNPPSKATLHLIAHIFGVTPESLLLPDHQPAVTLWNAHERYKSWPDGMVSDNSFSPNKP